jgi:hypothetical protein
MENENLMVEQSERGEMMEFFENWVTSDDSKTSEAEFLEELVVIRQTNIDDWAKTHEDEN